MIYTKSINPDSLRPKSIRPDELINLKLIIEYDGAAYFGWQRQKDKPSIQQKIEKALSVLFKDETITIIGAGRTDAGVHAFKQCANFKCSKLKYLSNGNFKLKHSLNALLPDDIVIKKISKVPVDFHARYSAKKREYVYLFSNKIIALNREKIFYIRQKPDLLLAKKFCSKIIGYHSFRSLCKNKQDKHGFMCSVFSAGIVKKKNGIFEFKITANRFLHSMVRGVVGAMLKVSTGGLSIEEFNKKFIKGDEIKIQYVPSKALFLSNVIY